MAEIKVEKKSSPWPWIIALVVLALLIWAAFAMFNDGDRVDDTAYAGDDTAAMAPAATVGDNNADTGSFASPDAGNAAGESGATRVYFPLDQAELTDEGRNVLDQVAQEASMDANTEIVLASYTDTTGTRPYNEELSERRGEAVLQYLVDQGIAEDRISVEAHGQSNLLVDTDDSVREDDNRRVRIEFGDEM